MLIYISFSLYLDRCYENKLCFQARAASNVFQLLCFNKQKHEEEGVTCLFI